MARVQIDFTTLRLESPAIVEDHAWESLQHLGLEKDVKSQLLFWGYHFNCDGFYNKDKTATLRHTLGKIQIPKYYVLPLYEKSEFEKGALPRGFASIERLVVGTIHEFTDDELARDAFFERGKVIPSMRKFYPSVDEQTIFSCFLFGGVKFKPTEHEVKAYFGRRR